MGWGVVYKAEDTKLHRTVALKFLRSEPVESEELKARPGGSQVKWSRVTVLLVLRRNNEFGVCIIASGGSPRPSSCLPLRLPLDAHQLRLAVIV